MPQRDSSREPPPPDSPRLSKRARRGDAPAAAEEERELRKKELSCPICLELAAFVAKGPCDHVLCWTCSHQLFRAAARPVRCPQCRGELDEAQLRSCPETDALVAELASEELDAEARADWEQKKREGAELHARLQTQAQQQQQPSSQGAVVAERGAGQRQMLALGYTFSCAPSGRAVCRNESCGERIKRGRLRLELEQRFVHVGCHDYQRDLDAACAAARVGASASSEVTVTMTATVQPPHSGVRLKERSEYNRDIETLKERLRATAGNRPWWLTVEMGGNLFADEREDIEEGDEFLRTIDETMNHSVQLFESGDVAAAVRECEGAVQRLRTAFGATNIHTLHAQLLLANLIGAKHAYLLRCIFMLKMIVLPRQARGKRRESTQHSDAFFAGKQGGRLEESAAVYSDVIDQLKEQLGETDLETLAAQVDLANVLTRMDRLHEAREKLTAVLFEYERQLGTSHEDTMDARHSLANLLHEQGQLNVARGMFETLLAQRRRIDGEQAQATTGVKMCLANVLMQQGRLQESRALHEEVVGILTDILGAGHPDVHSARNNLATVSLHDACR
jgi:hypothetical protein